MNTDRFELSSESDWHKKPNAHSESEIIDFNINIHNDQRINIKTIWKGLSNTQLNDKIEEKLLGSGWESVSLNDIQRKLQNLEKEELKNLSYAGCESFPNFWN